MANFGERLAQRQWVFPFVSIIIALGSVGVALLSSMDANRAREIENQHYLELTKPHTLEQETRDKLDILERMMSRAETWVNALRDEGQAVPNLSDGLMDATILKTQAETNFIDGKFSDAEKDIQDAAYILSGILRSPLDSRFSSVIVKAGGGMILGIDMDPETTGKTREGNPLNRITIAADGVPSAENGYVVISAYDFMPFGAILSQPITIRLYYETVNVPQGFNEKKLVLAAWDVDNEKWVEIRPHDIDTDSNIMTGKIGRLSPVAVLARLSAERDAMNWRPYYIVGAVILLLILASILLAGLVPPKRKGKIGFSAGR